MRTKNELYQEALRTVARRRQTARAKAEDARAEAEAAVPGLRHAEEEVRVRGIRCALAGAAGKDRTDAAAALTDARKKLADLLASSGRPADALEPHFTCRLCEDTGIVDGRTCSCVHKVMQHRKVIDIAAYIYGNCCRYITKKRNLQIIFSLLYSLYRKFSFLIGYGPQIGTFNENRSTRQRGIRFCLGHTSRDCIDV